MGDVRGEKDTDTATAFLGQAIALVGREPTRYNQLMKSVLKLTTLNKHVLLRKVAAVEIKVCCIERHELGIKHVLNLPGRV